MQIKTIAMLAVAGCAIGMLTGCGVPQEEHDAIVAKLKSDSEAALNAKDLELQEAVSLQKAAEETVSSLRGDLRNSNALNGEQKNTISDLKGEIAKVRGEVSSLESQLKSTKASVRSAQSMAAEAEEERAAMEMQAQSDRERFEALIVNLIELNKLKPADVGFPELTGSVSVDDSFSSEPATGESALDLLDQMGSM